LWLRKAKRNLSLSRCEKSAIQRWICDWVTNNNILKK
jgi:hypothetical protein